jgi:peptidoglycan/LPS O-acetylase OafA/YrhL
MGLVFVAHAGLDNLVPGGLGVTIFFFLSGFLITTLLMREHLQTGRISLKAFYVRRVKRILPPMYVAIVIGLALVSLGLQQGAVTWQGVLAQAGHCANYFVIITGGGKGMIPGLGLLWSLAVEEHFYFLFPLALILALRRYPVASVAKGVVAICAIVLLWRCYLVLGLHVSTDRTYVATDTRLDSILWGCFLALWRNPATTPDAARRLAGNRWLFAGLGVLVFSLLVRNPSFRETLRYSLQSMALAPIFAAVILRTRESGFRWLENKAVVFIGRISYSFYLLHVLALNLTHRYLATGDAVRGVVAFLGTAAAATLMLVLVEQPVARWGRRHRGIRGEVTELPQSESGYMADSA